MAAEGFAAIPNWFLRDRSYSASDKVVYAVLASRTGRNGTWAMSLPEIAEESGLSVATVKRSRATLKVAGLISWETPMDEMGKGKSIYRVHSSVPSPKATAQNAPSVQDELSAQIDPSVQIDPSTQEPNVETAQNEPYLSRRKKNRSFSPSVEVGFVAPQADATTTEPEETGEDDDPTTPRGTRLPAKWAPTERSIETILGEYPHITRDHLRAEHKLFRDHWAGAAGRGATKVNWDAAWRNWMRKADWSKVANVRPLPTRQRPQYVDPNIAALNPRHFGGAR